MQVPQGVPSGPMSLVLAAQVSTAPALHLLQLALSGKTTSFSSTQRHLMVLLSESEATKAGKEEGPDVQLQRGHLLREVR